MTFHSRLFAASVVIASSACAVNPATGKREIMLVSEGQELAMGKQYDQQLVAELGLYDDPALAGYVQQLGLRLAALSERPQLPWAFRLVDDPVVNAFAVPGGYIYITRGIMVHMGSEAQLVSVLGHEIGHVTARHTAQQITQQQLVGLGLGIGSLFSPTAAGIASVGAQVLFLKFSRDDESQADELGFRYMRAARYDPREAADVFAQLARVSGTSGSRLPEWQSTHPDPENRRGKALARAATLPEAELSAAAVRRDEYLNRLDAMVFGPDPRHSRRYRPRPLRHGVPDRHRRPAGRRLARGRLRDRAGRRPFGDGAGYPESAGAGHGAPEGRDQGRLSGPPPTLMARR